MSLPPEVITVRRKRRAGTDDGPINFLRVEETKRQRSGTWLYRRKEPEPQSGERSTETLPGKPVVHSSRPGDEKIPLGTRSHVAAAGLHGRTAEDTKPPAAIPPPTGAAEPRRFHLSRPTTADQGTGTASKRSRHTSALFVERTGKRKKSPDRQPRPQQQQAEASADMEMEDAPARPQRRPGVAARTARPAAAPQLPPSLRNRQFDTSAEALGREMDSWALEHVAHALARQEEERAEEKKKKEERTQQRTATKYRPRAPSKRLAELHPQVAPPGVGDGDVDMEGQSEAEDGEDYVVETYVRVPAHTVRGPVRPEEMGLLVFDQGSDVEYFYGAESDSEEEYLEDDEDSNAEDYYTADYPEDEVDSDDEYGRNAYRYRTGNASDLEEFDNADDDDEDIARSDDEAEPPGTRLWRQQDSIRSPFGMPKMKY